MARLIPTLMTVETHIKMYSRIDDDGNPYTKLLVNNNEYTVYGFIEIDSNNIKFKHYE